MAEVVDERYVIVRGEELPRCQEFARSGLQCQNPAADDSDTCELHAQLPRQDATVHVTAEIPSEPVEALRQALAPKMGEVTDAVVGAITDESLPPDKRATIALKAINAASPKRTVSVTASMPRSVEEVEERFGDMHRPGSWEELKALAREVGPA